MRIAVLARMLRAFATDANDVPFKAVKPTISAMRISAIQVVWPARTRRAFGRASRACRTLVHVGAAELAAGCMLIAVLRPWA